MADLSVREAAVRAHTSDRTVRRWIAEGKLNATRHADAWTVTESDLAAYLDGRTAPADHVDTRGAVRPSEAPLLAELLASTQTQLLQATAAAAMWQARAQHLQEQLEHALPAPAPTTETASANDTAEPTQRPAESKRPWWRAWLPAT